MAKVLIIDDSKLMRMKTGMMFKSMSYKVSEAEDGLDGIKKLEEQGNPDLIFLDWNMPNMDGLEFLKYVRQKNEYANVKIVMATTENEMAQMVKAIGAGADEYVMKPFEIEVLKDKLQILGLPN